MTIIRKINNNIVDPNELNKYHITNTVLISNIKKIRSQIISNKDNNTNNSTT